MIYICKYIYSNVIYKYDKVCDAKLTIRILFLVLVLCNLKSTKLTVASPHTLSKRRVPNMPLPHPDLTAGKALDHGKVSTNTSFMSYTPMPENVVLYNLEPGTSKPGKVI